MEVRRHQRPCIQAGASGLANSIREPLQESFPVIIVTKDIPAFYPSRHNVMDQSWNV
jgi:hypothetical protein